MITAFNQRHHLNRWCVVLSRDSIYAVESMRLTCATVYVISRGYKTELSDSSDQAGFLKKNRSQSERRVCIWILSMRIRQKMENL